MHADTPVLTGVFCDIGFMYVTNVHDSRHVPVGCLDASGGLDAGRLSRWFGRRQVSRTRHNLDAVRHALRGATPGILSIYNLMANLSDQYWIKPVGSGLGHSDVSFFRNDFWFDSLPAFLRGGEPAHGRHDVPDLRSPSCCTNGDTPKAWALDSDGSRVLYKSSGSTFGQEPYNERIASCVLDVMGAPHVRYDLFTYDGMDCSTCRCAVGSNQDFVLACDVVHGLGQSRLGGFSKLDVYVRFAEAAGIPDIRSQIECQIVLDYLMRNTGRHWADFGLLRDVRTLEYAGAMPIFGNGGSLYHDSRRILIASDGRSSLTGQALERDLAYVRTFTRGMRAAAYRFPGIVQQVLFCSDMPDGRKWDLVDAATYRADNLLRYFGEPGLCCL